MNELDNQQQQQLPLKQSLAQQINPYVDYSKQKFDINRQTPYYTLNKSRLSNKSRSQPNTRLSSTVITFINYMLFVQRDVALSLRLRVSIFKEEWILMN